MGRETFWNDQNKKVVPGIEPGLQESESWVLTITLHNLLIGIIKQNNKYHPISTRSLLGHLGDGRHRDGFAVVLYTGVRLEEDEGKGWGLASCFFDCRSRRWLCVILL